MLRLQKLDKGYSVYQDDQYIGTVELYDNPYHTRNCYVKLELDRFDADISAELFEKLRAMAGRPLQVMVSSDNTALTEFLIAGGLTCRRKCYETEAGAKDYIGEKADVPLLHIRAGEPDYTLCCRMMFDYYVETHKAVNPWTADQETFCRNMPARVIYQKADGKITNLAFVEENEIAYLCGSDRQGFKAFAFGLITFLFERYETICFESDDSDWAATQLRAMFKNQDETSFDTYVYDNERAIPC